ncbi:Glutamate-tRNA ligase [Rhodotorula toruloides ATCC 204091]|uniref:Glutamate--tRNA ligase, mitochondrial n=1 Tax=Rhodotorula toruloides TaxID=5286 RepID=A0A0K3CFM2_RHOTO|nr:Glutamate-tRNA ligase [Rhodotorula toruloides ATCC 204091]PRQ74212.1 glutamate-tRNA ligase [Rhodotorula toruloides]
MLAAVRPRLVRLSRRAHRDDLPLKYGLRAFSTSQRPLHAGCSNPATSSSAPPKLRFAPSPTGYLHLGGLRTALYNHLLARKLGGKWVLRIEDTDQTRYVEGAVESLLRTLEWAKLDFDEGPGRDGGKGPYFQSQRKEVYDRYLEPLISSGKAYHCFCTPERLASTRKRLQKEGSNEGYDRRCLGLSKEEVQERLAKGERNIVRFKSSNASMTQEDLIYDSIHYDSLPLEDFVLRKSDGLPTYHFANVVDDYEMGITHVLRGEEWLPSTPKHMQLYDALGLPRPKFAHLPLLVNPDGSKLSKRAGDVRVEDYIAKSYEPEALLNFVALMGWSPQSSASSPPPKDSESAASAVPDSDHTDVLPLHDLIAQFSLEAVNKNRASMQAAKLDFLNRAHIRLKLDDRSEGGGRAELAKRARQILVDKWPALAQEKSTEESYVVRVVEALKDRIYKLLDIPSLGPYFFSAPDYSSALATKLYSGVSPEIYTSTLSKVRDLVSSLPDSAFEPPSTPDAPSPVKEALDQLVLSHPDGKKAAKEIMMPLRHALTGQKVGAGVPDIVSVLGKAEVLARLDSGLAWAKEREHA